MGTDVLACLLVHCCGGGWGLTCLLACSLLGGQVGTDLLGCFFNLGGGGELACLLACLLLGAGGD